MSKAKDDKDEAQPSKWGKGKTDEASWFKKGCKPGPGRPKGSKNFKTIWAEANAEKVTISVGGKPKQITKGELKYQQLATKAAQGEPKAMALAISLDEKWQPVEAEPPTSEDTAADLATLNDYIALQQKFGKSEGEGA